MFFTIVVGPIYQPGRIVKVCSLERDACLFARLQTGGLGWKEISPNHWVSETEFVAIEKFSTPPSVFEPPKDPYSVKLRESCFNK